MTTAVKETFESVTCPTCAGLGRSITLCKRDRFGNLYFIGKLVDVMRWDARLQAMVLPCRVCSTAMAVPLTRCVTM